MKIDQLVQFLHRTAPLSLQEDYDNAGLIVGSPDTEISGVLICLDAIESVVDEAIILNCNLIIAHHPIIFRGLKKLNGTNYIERTVIKALKNDIAIFAIHTNLDNVILSGVNTKIAEKLKLTDTSLLAPKPGIYHDGNPVGSGMIGSLTGIFTADSFMEYLKDKMELNIVKHTELCMPYIRRVAICGGSGGFLLKEAKQQGADIFITSDFKYHEYFDADGEIIIADIGHFESEKYTIELLYELIINNFSTFAAHCTKIITNPIKYFQ
ncbi:MAG: Nif3-like dinuclear metal center hexameric protein [Saprospiraceae bacterium]|jgi:dinuclear metal center YbgI/SA1388 family protein|nr:Nif3-like dinuclear metal center hexameric protein [Saprospiraceae bacterium]MBL0026181.1 Nif3-like dinuclear metal center hexameric protein [Saprospiraceae bacterium]